MGPCKKFYSIHPGESLEELRRKRGISLCELLHEIDRLEHQESIEYLPPKDLTFDNLSEDDRQAQDQLKKLRGALNKIAPDNFYIQLLELQDSLPVHSCHLMKIFVRQLVEKATYDTYYSSLYAYLCKALSTIELIEVPEDDDSINTFGDLILDECYRYFTYNRSSVNWFSFHISTNEELMALEAEECKKRRTLVGLVRFLGELYKAGMMNVKEIYEYIRKLEQETSEKCIEALCRILTTVGRELEADVFQTEFAGDWCATWERIVNLSKREAKLPLRQMFMLMDLLDLMNNGWVSKRPLPVPKSYLEILLDYQEKEKDNPSTMKTKAEKKAVVQSSENTNISDSIIANDPIVIKTEQQILQFLKSEGEAYNLISSWEMDNFEGRRTWFMYSLMRAILRVSIDGNSLNTSRFLGHVELLKKYISSRQAEVACLFAVQYIVVVELLNPKGLLESIILNLHKTGAITYIGLLDWRENWSGHSLLEIRGRSAAHITLASLFIKLFWESTKPNYKPVIKELNSFDLEHFVSSSKLPPEIVKRTKMEEERDKTALSKNLRKENSAEESSSSDSLFLMKSY